MGQNIPQIFDNERALANAGSGKTYTIVTRYIALSLRDDCTPDQICALTFTRMSAAEFLDNILKRLAAASINEGAAEILSGELNELGLTKKFTSADFRAHLKRVVSLLPKLKLTTIDAFEASFASAFATELGIFSEVKVMDEFEKNNAKKSSAILALESVNADNKTRDNFLNEVAKASYGANNKMILEKIESFVSSAEPFLSEVPDLDRWGNSEDFDFAIPPRKWDENSYKKNCALLESSLGNNVNFRQLFTFFSNSRVGNIDKPTKIVSTLASYIREGNPLATFSYTASRKKNAENEMLPETAIEPLTNLLNMLVGSVLMASLDSAKAIGQIVSLYEKEYSEKIKAKGKLDFSDFANLLSSGENSFARELVEYRLDARFKHWLLDEFQDTSHEQWKALGNLMNEVICDDSGDRTLFYVGDKKQAIYGWRGADSSLFDTIFEKYSPRIHQHKPLAESRRSSAPIIDAVNTLFSPESTFLKSINTEAANDWSKCWAKHLVAGLESDKLKSIGCTGIIDSVDDNRKRAKIIFSIIEKFYSETENFSDGSRHLSFAILTQKNDTAVDILDSLREISAEKSSKGQHIPFTFSGELDVAAACDNMANVAILSALEYAFHPLETASGIFSKMTPLKSLLESQNWRENVISSSTENGFEGAIVLLAKSFEEGARISGKKLSTFERQRIETLVKIARDFDNSESSGIDEFLQFARIYRKRESSKKSEVTVMTIHKSKGLTFDVVFLPELKSGRGMPSSTRLKILESNKGERAIINMPPKEICEFDSFLKRIVEDDERKKSFDTLCKFYVACTRPRYGLYLFAELDKKKGNRKYSFEDLVVDSLSAGEKSLLFDEVEMKVAYGTDDWFIKKSEIDKLNLANAKIKFSERLPKDENDDIEILDSPTLAPTPKWASSPSAITHQSEHVESLETLHKASKAMEFGAIAHIMLSKIIKLSDFPACLSNFESHPDFNKIKDYLAKNFENPDFAKFFEIENNVEVLNEYPFTHFANGETTSGIIDRLMLEKSPAGKIIGAKIIDYKTDRLNHNELIDKYSPQLDAYRRAISDAFSLPYDKIECEILGLYNIV